MEPLLPFQSRAVTEIERRRGRALLALDMGLGKTVIALNYLRRNLDAWPAVVVCPAAVKYQWQREAQRWCGEDSVVLEGKNREEQIPNNGITIVNYDILDSRVEELMRIEPRTIIVDECHYIANPKAKRSKAVRALAYRRPHVLALSGTPMLNRPIELFNTLQMLWPWEWKSRWEYAQRYCSPRWTPWGWKYDGASNVGELHRRLLKSGMIRYRKADVLSELPDKIREVIPLPLENEVEYQEARDHFLQWLSALSPEAARRAQRAEAMTKIGYLLRLAAKLKIGYVLEWVKEILEESRKIAVFAVHKEIIHTLAEELRSDYGCVVVDGSVVGLSRQKLVDQFQQDVNTRVFIGQLQAAGVGLNLTAADTVVFAETDWVPSQFAQAEDRAHRIGTKSTVWCYYLVAKGTIEEDMCRIIQDKQELISNILDGSSRDEDLDIYDQLLRKLTGERCFDFVG